jgi:hypothetical protein
MKPIRCFLGFHVWTFMRIIHFDSPKMDSYGKIGINHENRRCVHCGMITTKVSN